MASVRIPTPLRKLTNGQEEVKASGGSVAAVIADLDKQYPGLRERICDDQGKVRRFVNIFKNDEDIRFLQNLDTPVADTDELSIVPAIAGGLTAAAGMSLSLEQTRRFARQIALPEVGVDGQARLAAAAVALVRPAAGADPRRGQSAAEYLAGGGRGPGRASGAPRRGRRGLGDGAWRGSDAVVRLQLRRRRAPAGHGAAGPARWCSARAQADQVDVLSFRRHGPCPHVALDVPVARRRRARAGQRGARRRWPARWSPAEAAGDPGGARRQAPGPASCACRWPGASGRGPPRSASSPGRPSASSAAARARKPPSRECGRERPARPRSSVDAEAVAPRPRAASPRASPISSATRPSCGCARSIATSRGSRSGPSASS